MRGEIWLVNLDPTVGSEIGKTRPCAVVSPTEIVAPMTTKNRAAPFRVGVTHGGQKGSILLDRIVRRGQDTVSEEAWNGVGKDTRIPRAEQVGIEAERPSLPGGFDQVEHV